MSDYFKKVIKSLLPAVRVHIWGGLGSQLFGVLVSKRLSHVFTYRAVKLYFHSSGVTQRFREVPDSLLVDLNSSDVFDYAISQDSIESDVNVAKFFRSLTRKLLQTLGLLASLNTELDFLRIKPWLISVRGHYTGIHLTCREIDDIASLIGIDYQLLEREIVGMHLRLGDLLSLQNKTYIPSGRIKEIVEGIKSQNKKDLHVYSDSKSSEVFNYFAGDLVPQQITAFNLEGIETIQRCVNYEIFVGTNSKLTMWICILRIRSPHPLITFVPHEIENTCHTLLSKIQSRKSYNIF